MNESPLSNPRSAFLCVSMKECFFWIPRPLRGADISSATEDSFY